MNILIIIPARGGSKGIPQKNIRFMNGRPLISYAIKNALLVPDAEVIVSSENIEILEIAEKYGAKGLLRPKDLSADDVALDPVIAHAVFKMEQLTNQTYNVVITMQPTSPLLKSATLNKAVREFIEKNYDTVISAVNHPHLSWQKQNDQYIPNYKKRLNRQKLPADFMETGAFVITKREFITTYSRFGPNLSIYEIPEDESLDIDTYQDWWTAETALKKKKIRIYTAGYKKIGTGHIFRCLQLANSMAEHEIKFIIEKKSDLAVSMIRNSNYPFTVIDNEDELFHTLECERADILINDVLDTDISFMKKLKKTSLRIINFEDLGTGSKYADAVINDIYDKTLEGRQYYWGSEYYILRDEFQLEQPKPFSPRVNNILVMFGGTDPADLTQKTLKALIPVLTDNKIHCTVILGIGYEKRNDVECFSAQNGFQNIEIHQNVNRMSKYIKQADIAISSCGRSMYELACLGVPTILMAQNTREMEHSFGGLKNGYLNLGLGEKIEQHTLTRTIQWLADCPSIREEMHNCLLKIPLKNGINKVKKIILEQ